MSIDYSVYRLSLKQTVIYLLVGSIISFEVVYLFFHSVIISVLSGIAPVLFMDHYSRSLAQKRKNMLIAQFKDMLYSLSSSIAAGRQMSEALSDAYDSLDLIYSRDTPLMEELSYMVRCIKTNRESEEQLLLNFSRRSHCEDIENFSQIYAICRKTGGDLNKVLKDTSEILIDKITVQKEIKTLTAQKKLEGRIITALPLIVVMALNFFSPDYTEVLYTTVAGRLIMLAALIGILAAWLMMERITYVEI